MIRSVLSTFAVVCLLLGVVDVRAQQVEPWPSFRGAHAAGVADGNGLPLLWNGETGDNVAWRTPIAGLGHSSPIVWGDRIYVTTAVAEGAEVGVITGDVDAAGIDPANDLVPHAWHLFAVDLPSGEIVWDTVARRGVPRLARHVKSSHASATPATDGERIVALLGTEGLFCFDMNGDVLWRTDVGLLDVGLWGEPDYQWGAASSPVIWRDRVFVQNDRHEDSFVAAYDLETGAELWRAARDEKPAWSTPTVLGGEVEQLITNGANWIRSYDPRTGEELWRVPHGDLEVIVPTPVIGDGRVFVTGGYPAGAQPIYALEPVVGGTTADPAGGAHAADDEAVEFLWQAERGSPYTSTPLAYRGLLYVITDSGILSAYDLGTGDRVYRERVAVGSGFSASPVASDGRIYLASEDGDVFVVRAGREFELLARNPMGEILMATPAIASGTLVVRGRSHLFAVRAGQRAGSARQLERGPDDAAARAALRRGVSSMGGRERLRDGGGIVWRASGTIDKTAERQGITPDRASNAEFRESVAVDPAAKRVAHEYREDRHDGTFEWIRQVYEGDDLSRVLVLQAGFVVEERGGEFGQQRAAIERRVPGLLLEQMLEMPARLRDGGVDEHGRRVVRGMLPGGRPAILYLDAETGVLHRLDYDIDLQTYGDARVTWRWSDYQQVGGLGLFPGRRSIEVAGRRYLDVVVDSVEVGGPELAAMFEVPAELRGPIVVDASNAGGGTSDAASGARVETVAPGVHRVRNLRGGFHPMFVEVEDFVVAMDAPAGFPLLNRLPATDIAPGPTSAWLSERYLQLIRAHVPDKPVRFVVITHFHNDHAGGVRAFVAEGATVLAAPQAAEAVRTLVEDMPHELAPDRLSRMPRPLQLEVVEGRRVIGEGSRRVEVIAVGANPHTDQMLALHIPDQGILFVSDLVEPTAPESYPAPSHASLDRWFFDWLASTPYTPRRIYTMHGNGLLTEEHFDRMRAHADARSAPAAAGRASGGR